jgi:hypothetical protein
MTSGHVTIDIDVLGQDECPTGQSVPVELCYLKDVDRSYGEDADGLRATTLVSYEILDHYIDPAHLAGLNSWQVERLIKDADAQLERRAP